MHVLCGQEIGRAAIDLIESRQANEVLIVVSAYFDPWERLETALKTAITRGNAERVFIVLRGGEKKAEHEQKLLPYKNSKVKTMTLSRLHAKFIVTSRKALFMSMNLTRTSEQNSWETAVEFDLAGNADATGQVGRAVKQLFEQVKNEQGIERHQAQQAQAQQALARSWAGLFVPRDRGSCIRCGVEVPLNAGAPLCGSCYAVWGAYRNESYPESYCHRCGDVADTSYGRPLCRPCWQETR